MNIMMITAEMAPYAKTGGLADVLGSLPRYLAELGHDVRCFIPLYGFIDRQQHGLELEISQVDTPMERWTEPAGIWKTSDESTTYFVASERYFDRENIYGYEDDGERFIFLCRTALETVRRLDWCPDVIHCHDWHTGLVPNWLKTTYREDLFFRDSRALFTIHNLAYQGLFSRDILAITGISDQASFEPDLGEMVVFMARGIIFADKVNTVSERYATEIRTPEFGERLDSFLRDRGDDLHGILNGIDNDLYDPATDPNLVLNFDIESLAGKAVNKRALQNEAGLEPDPRRPLCGFIARISHQKGMDLLEATLPAVIRAGGQFILLGTGDPHYEQVFRELTAAYPADCCANITFDAALAQRMYAGLDFMLIPSRYEPCGLTQMISMRYGTVPVVRETGGLADTVKNFDPATGAGTGFSFGAYDSLDFMGAITRAFELYRRPDEFGELVRRCMREDFSWPPSAREYDRLYRQMTVPG
jgi:starch synthase